MNLTSQYVSNPKSRNTYLIGLVTYKSIRPSSAKLRLGDDRQILNERIKPHRKIKIKVDDISFVMICCPKGVFTMGASDDQYANPKRTVSIDQSFLLGETEVTQELFEKVMGYNPSKFQGEEYPNLKQRPVERVTWYDALMFCNKLSERCKKKPYYNISNIEKTDTTWTRVNNRCVFLPNITNANITINDRANGFRLPYQKEWEYAAKAGTNNRWAGTDDKNKISEVAWFKDNSEINGNKQTHSIKGKRPNEWGFYDMTGNVYEWCWEDALGGSWNRPISYLHSTDRRGNYPLQSASTPAIDIGFRVSASLFN